ncbi:hypothetical protein GCM10019016_046520 [Streptomyces prasinosporus]|uniref:Uncharacterized protein n=1 Tax=Streptomyces prasinosporus TaxID=68256 RepID=A0ABP6TQG8_9ACTN
MLTAEPWTGDLALGIPVGHLDAHAVVAAQAQQVGGGARVHDGVGHQLAGEDHRVVHDVAKPQPWRVSRTKERALATDRPTGSKLAAARAVITELLDRFSAGMASWPAGLVPLLRQAVPRPWVPGAAPPGISPVVMCAAAPPMPARSRATAQAGRDRRGWTAACKVTYLRGPRWMPVCVFPSECSPSGGCADDVRSCRTVMAWFGRG